MFQRFRVYDTFNWDIYVSTSSPIFCFLYPNKNTQQKFRSIKVDRVPLQISTLVQHRTERSHVSSERTLRAIGRVGQAVSLAVERFVTVGETIADDNPEIRQDMYDACKDARAAGNYEKKFVYNLNESALSLIPPLLSLYDLRSLALK